MSSQFSRNHIEKRVRTIISEVTGYDEALLTLDARLTPDEAAEKALSVGSLELAELLISIDEEFQVNISDEEASALTTVESLVDCIIAKIK